MAEMVERVAKAICYAHGSRMCGPGMSIATREVGWKGDGEHNDIYVERHWKEHEIAAQFAIEAMREPTDAMCDAAEWHQQSEVNQYKDAIGEALK